MEKPKPAVEDILKLKKRCVKKYSGIHGKFQDDQKYYELDFSELLQLPDEYADQGTVLPTARDMVDSFVDHIDISNARVFVNQKGITPTAEDSAEMMRKFYLGLIHRTNTEASISPWRIAAKHYALHGVTFFKTLWDADMWPDKPERKTDESDEDYGERIKEWQHTTDLIVPLVIQAVNPACVMPDPDHFEPQYDFELHKRLSFNITQRYPNWSNPKNKEVDKEVEWVEYWDDTWKCFLADGEPVFKVGNGVVKHNYGFLPYVEINSGLGNWAIDGELAMRYVGILRYMYSLLVSESREYSVSDIVLMSEAWPWFTLEGPNANKVTEIDRYFGRATALPDGVKIVQQRPQVPPDSLRMQQGTTADLISSHAAPRTVRGLSEQGIRSAADRRLMIAEAGLRYSYSKDAFKNGTAKVLINCAHLFKNVVPGNIRLWARTPTDEFDDIIKKDLMKEPFTCYVEFAPISEEDEYRRHDDLERQVQTGLLTKKAARRQMSNVDPKALEQEELEETIKKSPALAQGIDQLISQRLAAALAQRNAAEQVGIPITGTPPVQPQTPAMPAGIMGRMTPPITQAVPPGSAQAIQTQLRQQRSQTPLRPGQGKGIFAGGARYA